MTDDRTLERAARSWLEQGPSQAPDRAVDAALSRIQTTRQERDLMIPWRFPSMNRYLLPLAAALIVVIGAAAVLMRNTPSIGPGTATPTPVASPDASTAEPTTDATLMPIHLTSTYTSLRYGYSIGVDPTWRTVDATAVWVGPDNSAPAVDEIHVADTVSSIKIASQPLPPDQTYEQWLAAFHANTASGVPANCNGGEPAAWPAVSIGSETGAWEQLCNGAEAVVLVQGRVYVFSWDNSSFNGRHLTPDQFREMLRTVTFSPETVPTPSPM